MADSESGIYTIGALEACASSVIGEIRERGKTALITDHGRLVAAITPFAGGEIKRQALGEMVREFQDVMVTLDRTSGVYGHGQ